MDASLHRVGLVVAEGHLRQGPAGPRLPDQPVLPALRHPAVRPRAGPARRLPRPSPTRPVTVRFPLPTLPAGAPPQLAGADLLVWTTTPWTLVSNTAVAVHPDVTYVRRPQGGRRRPGRGGRAAAAPGCSARAGTSPPGSTGASLVGATYQPPFGLVDIPDAHVVVTGVIRDHGGRHRPGPPGARVRRRRHGGVARARPAGGQPDPARTAGSRTTVPLVGGHVLQGRRPAADRRPGRPRAAVPVRAARAQLPALLAVRHRRCSTTRCPSWYIRTTAIKDQLLARERADQLAPARRSSTAGTASGCGTTWTGRCRGPGTGARRCRCGSAPQAHLTCVGSLAELCELAGRDLTGLDPHRPFVDEVTFACPDVRRGGAAGARGDRRLVRLGLDAVRPVRRAAAQAEASSRRRTRPSSSARRIDQTRGWFYSLMAVGTLVFGRSSYENVRLPRPARRRARPQDEQAPGQRARADAADGRARRRRAALVLRRRRLAVGRPGGSGTTALDEIVRKVLLTYWNTASFLVLYANAAAADGLAWTPAMVADAPALPTGRCSTGGCSASCTR